MDSSIDLSAFPKEREHTLKQMYRYQMFSTFLYRSNLWMHSWRVFWLAEAVLPYTRSLTACDPEKLRALALLHDDAEIITGDIPAGHKAFMTPEALKKLQDEEEQAAEILAQRYTSTVHGYSYRELLLHAARGDCVEARVVSYLDKLDALCECMHEVLAGNMSVVRAVIFYSMTLARFPARYPEIASFLGNKQSVFSYLDDRINREFIDASRYPHLGKPHTRESIALPTDFPFYNSWRDLVRERAGEEGIAWLIERREELAR